MKIVITLPLIAMLNQAEIDILLQYIKNIQSFNKKYGVFSSRVIEGFCVILQANDLLMKLIIWKMCANSRFSVILRYTITSFYFMNLQNYNKDDQKDK